MDRLFVIILGILLLSAPIGAQGRQVIKAIYIPLADHYPIQSGKADIAGIICPMAMDMFLEKEDFRWHVFNSPDWWRSGPGGIAASGAEKGMISAGKNGK